MNVLFAEWKITELDYFQILLLEILSGLEPNIYLQIYNIDAATATFRVLDGKCIFPQLQTCSADRTEGSCSSNTPYISNFYQLFSF